MTKMSSTMFSVGTLLRRAEDTRHRGEGARPEQLARRAASSACDGLGAVLDDGRGQPVAASGSTRIAAVTFVWAEMEDDLVDGTARSHGTRQRPDRAPVPITVPAPSTRRATTSSAQSAY